MKSANTWDACTNLLNLSVYWTCWFPLPTCVPCLIMVSSQAKNYFVPAFPMCFFTLYKYKLIALISNNVLRSLPSYFTQFLVLLWDTFIFNLSSVICFFFSFLYSLRNVLSLLSNCIFIYFFISATRIH